LIVLNLQSHKRLEQEDSMFKRMPVDVSSDNMPLKGLLSKKSLKPYDIQHPVESTITGV